MSRSSTNLPRRTIDVELECASLTPIRPIGERLSAWRETSGQHLPHDDEAGPVALRLLQQERRRARHQPAPGHRVGDADGGGEFLGAPALENPPAAGDWAAIYNQMTEIHQSGT